MYRVPSPPEPGPERAPRPGRTRALRGAICALAAAALIGCEDPAAQPGRLTATLISPNGAEGAALFELPVDGVLAVQPKVGALIESQSGGRRYVAVVLSQPGAIALELSVADQTHPPAVQVLQVSGPDDAARALAGYRVQLELPR